MRGSSVYCSWHIVFYFFIQSKHHCKQNKAKIILLLIRLCGNYITAWEVCLFIWLIYWTINVWSRRCAIKKKPGAAVTGFLWRPEISCQAERLGKYHSFLLSTLSGSFSEIFFLNKRVRPDGTLRAFSRVDLFRLQSSDESNTQLCYLPLPWLAWVLTEHSFLDEAYALSLIETICLS